MTTEITTTANLPVSVAYSHDLLDALYDGGCQKGKGKDFTVLEMGGGHGDSLILHSQKALDIWESLPKNHGDKCAVGFGAGTGMYIRE
jgi:hypothetical protein